MGYQQRPVKVRRNCTKESEISLKVNYNSYKYLSPSMYFVDELNIQRQVNILGVSRVTTGPDILGCRPVLVTFQFFKDRFDVLTSAR